MPGIVIVGVQWGDEGKGKATDLLGERTDWVVKFNGGNNAGHTVVIGDEKYALHLLPSGILTPGVNAVIGNGVVVDLEVLFAELEALHARGVDTSRLKVSANAHLITHYLHDDVAGRLHTYYNAERFLVEDENLKRSRLALVAATRQVLANGLALIGVSAPERM